MIVHKNFNQIVDGMKTLLEKYGKDLDDDKRQRFLLVMYKLIHWNLNYVRVVNIYLEDFKVGEDR